MAGADSGVAVGDLRTVVVQGDPAPAAVGGEYDRIRSASVNDAGIVVFAADLTGALAASAIVRVVDGNSTVVARSGEPAPGGGRYESFGEIDIGDEDGCLLFRARLAGCQAGEGVFLRTTSGTQVVARTDTGSGSVSFDQLTLVSYQLPSGPYFRLAYVAHTVDGGSSLVVWPSYRGPSTVLTTGEAVAGGILEDFSSSRLAFAACVLARIRRHTGTRRVALLACEDQLTWGPQLREGGRFPDLGRISRLRGPAGMYVYRGFVAAELDDQSSALITCSAAADPEVFARSGGPAPGMPDQHIVRFGPAVANHGLPDGGLCGVASAVGLDDGRRALWLGVFTSQQPMTGAAVTPLVSGDHTDDQPAVRVDGFIPIKLTNTGTMLLRSTLDVGGRLAHGLLRFDRLFDWHNPLRSGSAAV